MENKNLKNIDPSVVLGKNTNIGEYVVIKGNSKIGNNVVIDGFTYINNSVIEDNAKIITSHIEDSIIKEFCEVGPFSKIIKNSEIREQAVIGNFVEIKNSKIGERTKIKHHAYVGDSDLGMECNIGCGVIFANYSGKEKHKIKVGDNVFVGSNSVLIAPLDIQKNCYICAGTNLTKNLKENSFVIGRSREIIKENMAKKYLKNYK
ncbi:MAG: hypothetical protein IJW82_03220 [Clostridia bacterium]|nr:hypothetical protein [Clostridia bacterium]